MASEMSRQLFEVLQKKGYPDEFCAEIAYRQLNTDYTAKRMLGYLRQFPNPRIEDVVDEMLAILSDREMFIKKHEAQRAQAKLNEIYRNGLGDTQEDLW